MRNWACARKARDFSLFISHFSFLICHFFNFLFCHLSFLNLSHLSFVIFLTLSFSSLFPFHFSFLICHFLTREREGDPCIDAQQDDEQGLDGVDNQHEEQGIV